MRKFSWGINHGISRLIYWSSAVILTPKSLLSSPSFIKKFFYNKKTLEKSKSEAGKNKASMICFGMVQQGPRDKVL